MAAKCPKCDKLLGSVNISDVTVSSLPGPSWNGIAYLCPFCLSILSVGIDPVALKTDTVAEVVAAVKKLLR
jgi:hypothetical protein